MPTITGVHPVAFTVQDVDASAAWYQDLFVMQPLLQADDEDIRIRVLAHPDSGSTGRSPSSSPSATSSLGAGAGSAGTRRSVESA
jgi:catechol 2,3-dioxygenase-like lactoylglutathione lyase family enzyme